MMVQCALSVADKQCCHLDFIKKEFVWYIVGYFNPVSGHGTISAFSGQSSENRDGWSTCSTLNRESLN